MNKNEKQQLIEKLSFNLSRNFTRQGFSNEKYHKLIHDVHSIIKPGGRFTIEGVNIKLFFMGWPKDILSDYDFELIVHLLEIEENYTVRAIPHSEFTN